MKKLFAFLIVVVICVVAVGFYRSWFTVTSPSSDTESRKVNVSVTLDPDKVTADTQAVKDKAMELTSQTTDAAKELVNQTTDEPTTDELKSDDE